MGEGSSKGGRGEDEKFGFPVSEVPWGEDSWQSQLLMYLHGQICMGKAQNKGLIQEFLGSFLTLFPLL